ncbi:MAG: hypothetical protein IPK26_29825 [Planctomycetes bacterium]|nr:hypothetical protein [Planctomycetota bacterium]
MPSTFQPLRAVNVELLTCTDEPAAIVTLSKVPLPSTISSTFGLVRIRHCGRCRRVPTRDW